MIKYTDLPYIQKGEYINGFGVTLKITMEGGSVIEVHPLIGQKE